MKTLLITTLLLMSGFCLRAQEETPEIPPDLGKTKFTLLAISPEKNAPAKWLENALEKNYKGEYLIIELSEWSKHTDPVKYPYVLLVFDKYTPGSFGAGGRNAPSVSYSYGVREIATGKTYRWNSAKVNYKNMINDYVKAIEKVRKANSGE